MKIFSVQLRKARKKAGLTQREVATELDIPYRTYLNYEFARNEPTLDMVSKIADILGVTVDFLFGRE